MSRIAQALASLGAVFGNEQLRRLELACGRFDHRRMGAFRRARHLRLRGGRCCRRSGSSVSSACCRRPSWRRSPPLWAIASAGSSSSLGVSFLGALALAASAGAVALELDAAFVYALAAVLAIASTLFRPAHQACSLRSPGRPRS